MSFKNHETFIRGTNVRADKFLIELGKLIAQKQDNEEYLNIKKFLQHFSDVVEFASYQKDWLEKALIEFYTKYRNQFEQHNYVVLRKAQKSKCPNCSKKVFTVLSPNDFEVRSRLADERIFCFDCQWTWLVHPDKTLFRQSIYAFLKTNLKHYNIKLEE